MKYRSEALASSVPPPPLAPPPPPPGTDALQDLLSRKQEAERNRARFHLTESDCNLILTNSTDYTYTGGQIIADEGQAINSVYRIKSGSVLLMKQGHKLYELIQGYFIGEGLFIRGEHRDMFGATLVANGTVVISEVNLPLAQQLLEADRVSPFKIYRHMASKLSNLLFSVIGTVLESRESHSWTTLSLPPSSVPPGSPPHTSSDSASSSRSNSTVSAGPSGSNIDLHSSGSSSGSVPDLQYPPRIAIMSEEMANNGRSRKKKRSKRNSGGAPFKVYNLDGTSHGGGTCQLDNNKITISSGCTFKPNKKIKYNKILDVAKTGKQSVTIIYNVKARTLFFKSEEDLNEFYSIVQSLVASISRSRSNSPSPRSSHSNLPTVPPKEISNGECDPSDKAYFHGIAVKQEVKRGDIIIAEGDLYQRIYTIASGQLTMSVNGRVLLTMGEGEVFGVLTLFHLRPSKLTIEVSSDTAILLIIPAYRILELINTNFPLAVRMHKKAAQLIYGQVEKVLHTREGIVKGFSEAHLLM